MANTANVYIDGFNLYYRCVKGTPYKWLDVGRLAALLLPKGIAVRRIRYFTARVKPLPSNPDAPVNQQVYLRALRTIPTLTITYGHFLSNAVNMPLANPTPGGPRFARVIRTDEKGNDSDLAEPVRLVKQEFGIRIGITLPSTGRPSVSLRNHADFVKPIRTGVLAASQFPPVLTDATGTFSKPRTW